LFSLKRSRRIGLLFASHKGNAEGPVGKRARRRQKGAQKGQEEVLFGSPRGAKKSDNSGVLSGQKSGKVDRFALAEGSVFSRKGGPLRVRRKQCGGNFRDCLPGGN